MQNLNNEVPNYKGKTAVVLGLGRSGLAAAKFLFQRGAKVRVSDTKPKDHLLEEVKTLQSISPEIEFEWGGNSPEFFAGSDLVVVSPSVNFQSPLIQELKNQNITILTSLDLALREINVPIVAFVGGHGKTTVIEFTKHILESCGKKVLVGSDLQGNILNSLSDDIKSEIVLLELSLSELDKLQSFKPAVIVLTNAVKNKYGEYSVEDSNKMLSQLIRSLEGNVTIIYNFRDSLLRNSMQALQGKKLLVRRKDIPTPANVTPVPIPGTYLVTTKDMVWTNGVAKEEYNLRYSQLFGLHNVDNLMYAVNIAKEFNCDQRSIQEALHSVVGVPHRLQLVRKKGGVRFINDSRSVNPEHLQLSLEAFPLDPIILIAGGKQSQDANFTCIKDFVKKRVKTLILVGEAKEQINRDIGDYSETFLVGTFDEAILISYQKSREGDVILLSPGCESYDMFNGYEERGEYFTKYLDEL